MMNYELDTIRRRFPFKSLKDALAHIIMEKPEILDVINKELAKEKPMRLECCIDDEDNPYIKIHFIRKELCENGINICIDTVDKNSVRISSNDQNIFYETDYDELTFSMLYVILLEKIIPIIGFEFIPSYLIHSDELDNNDKLFEDINMNYIVDTIMRLLVVEEYTNTDIYDIGESVKNIEYLIENDCLNKILEKYLAGSKYVNDDNKYSTDYKRFLEIKKSLDKTTQSLYVAFPFGKRFGNGCLYYRKNEKLIVFHLFNYPKYNPVIVFKYDDTKNKWLVNHKNICAINSETSFDQLDMLDCSNNWKDDIFILILLEYLNAGVQIYHKKCKIPENETTTVVYNSIIETYKKIKHSNPCPLFNDLPLEYSSYQIIIDMIARGKNISPNIVRNVLIHKGICDKEYMIYDTHGFIRELFSNNISIHEIEEITCLLIHQCSLVVWYTLITTEPVIDDFNIEFFLDDTAKEANMKALTLIIDNGIKHGLFKILDNDNKESIVEKIIDKIFEQTKYEYELRCKNHTLPSPMNVIKEINMSINDKYDNILEEFNGIIDDDDDIHEILTFEYYVADSMIEMSNRIGNKEYPHNPKIIYDSMNLANAFALHELKKVYDKYDKLQDITFEDFAIERIQKAIDSLKK